VALAKVALAGGGQKEKIPQQAQEKKTKKEKKKMRVGLCFSPLFFSLKHIYKETYNVLRDIA